MITIDVPMNGTPRPAESMSSAIYAGGTVRLISWLLHVAAIASLIAALCMAVVFAMGDASLPIPFRWFLADPVWDMGSAFLPLHWIAWKVFGMGLWSLTGVAVGYHLALLGAYLRRFGKGERGSPCLQQDCR